jgi:competence protein ComEA
MGQTPQFDSFSTQPLDALVQQPSQGQPISQSNLTELPESSTSIPAPRFPNKKKLTRIVAIIIILALGIALYFIWHTPASTNSTPAITQQNFSGTSSNNSVNTSSTQTTNGNLHVYVVGAIKHPGVYILPTGARVYLLLQDAGGPLPNADLVALNLAAPLSDGEEVYVTRIGEKPPTYVLGDVPLDAILLPHEPTHDRTYSLVDSGLGSASVCRSSCTLEGFSMRLTPFAVA